jgi:hypothetical protein
MSRRNHPNFRTKVKYLLKDYQRGKISAKGIEQWFRSFGLDGHLYCVYDILRFYHGPSRIFTRLGKAALKKNALVRVRDITRKGGSYHEIPFYRHVLETHVEIKKITVVSLVETTLDGIPKCRSTVNRNYETISNTVEYSPYEEKENS